MTRYLILAFMTLGGCYQAPVIADLPDLMQTDAMPTNDLTKDVDLAKNADLWTAGCAEWNSDAGPCP